MVRGFCGAQQKDVQSPTQSEVIANTQPSQSERLTPLRHLNAYTGKVY